MDIQMVAFLLTLFTATFLFFLSFIYNKDAESQSENKLEITSVFIIAMAFTFSGVSYLFL